MNPSSLAGDSRLQRGLAWAREASFAIDSVSVASADASFRRYFRLHLRQPHAGAQTLILMDAPPRQEDTEAFVRIGRGMRDAGLPVPEIFADDVANGFAILSDLGDTSLLRVLDDEPALAAPMYRQAGTYLQRLQYSDAAFIDTLPAYDADRLTADRDLGDYFEACLVHAPQAKLAANWILGDLMAWLNTENRAIAESPVSPEHLGQLLTLIDGGQISGKMGKTVFEEMVKTGQDPEAIVAARGLEQVSDAGELEAVVAKVLAAAPDEVAAYRQGKKKLMGFFVGQVMRETRGQANPKLVNEILQRMLAE